MKIKCLLTLNLLVTNLIVLASYFRQPSHKYLTDELVKNSNIILMVECWMQCAVFFFFWGGGGGGNIVLFTTRFFDVAKVTVLTPLSLLC